MSTEADCKQNSDSNVWQALQSDRGDVELFEKIMFLQGARFQP